MTAHWYDDNKIRNRRLLLLAKDAAIECSSNKATVCSYVHIFDKQWLKKRIINITIIRVRQEGGGRERQLKKCAIFE
jgi:hypothetical protein